MRTLLTAVLATLLLATPAAAHGHKATRHDHPRLPATVRLPDGFQPEGIAARGTTFFTGSRATGAIFKGDLRSGTGRVLVPGSAGDAALGMKVLGHLLVVAGGQTGTASVYDTRTGARRSRYQLTTQPSFVNDVVLTKGAAWFTDSVQQQLYRLAGGRVTTLPLTGDLVYDADPTTFDLNGIAAHGRFLISVQTRTGQLFRIDPRTGVTRNIALTGGDGNVAFGDGLLLRGRTLYVVQNQLNRIAVVRLSHDLTSGRITGTITNPAFDTPTTLTRALGALYAVNARFSTPPTPTTRYDVVRVPLRGHHG